MEDITNPKVKNIILENIFAKNRILDLNNSSLKELPNEIFEANHLEYLYLSNNLLECVPVALFDVFSKLKLLDLRFNKLTCIPKEIEKLKCLEILLLDGNNITILPNEIGLLENLKGLNIGTNPVTYPSVEVINSGYKAILYELSNVYYNNVDIDYSNEGKPEIDKSTNNYDLNATGDSKVSEKLFKPKIYKEIRQTFLEKNRKSGLKQKPVLTQSLKHENMVKLYPEPVSLENIERKMIEQMRLVKIKEAKQQKETILQIVKDKNAVSDWREDARELQASKRREQFNKLPMEIKLESDSRVLEAPFKIEKDYLEMINVDQLNSLKQKAIQKPPKPQPMDREVQLMLEAEKHQKQRTLHAQIRNHSEYLLNKRNHPKGTVAEEVDAAKRDLEIVMQLQKELQQNLSVI